MSKCCDDRQNNEKSEHPADFTAAKFTYTYEKSYTVNEDTAGAVSLSVYGHIVMQVRRICIFRDAVLHERLQAILKIKPHSVTALSAAG
jgi:hypothetical protein